MKIKIMAVLLLLMVTFTGCSTTKDDNSLKTKAVTIYFRDDSSIAANSSESEVEVDSEVDSKPKTTTTTTSATTEKKVTAEIKQTTKIVNAAAPIEKTTTATQETFKQPEITTQATTAATTQDTTIAATQNTTAAQTTTTIKAATTIAEVTTTTTSVSSATAKNNTTTTTTTSIIPKTKQEVEVSYSYRLPYVLSDRDWNDICKVVCNETGYCSERQQKAVANTIFNRIIWASQYVNPFPTGVYNIVRQAGQYDAIYQYRADARLNPGGSLWNQTMKFIKEAALEPDFTCGAIAYYNPYMSGYLSAFENNRALVFCYADTTGRFFKLNSSYYTHR